MVQNLQHHLLFKVAQGISTDHVFFGLVDVFGGLLDALNQGFFVQTGVFVQPLGQRQIQIQLFFQLSFQTRYVPLLCHGALRDKFTDHLGNDVLAHHLDQVCNVFSFEQLNTL